MTFQPTNLGFAGEQKYASGMPPPWGALSSRRLPHGLAAKNRSFTFLLVQLSKTSVSRILSPDQPENTGVGAISVTPLSRRSFMNFSTFLTQTGFRVLSSRIRS